MKNKLKKIFFNIILISSFASIAFSYFHQISSQWLHIDEHAWVRRGLYFFQKGFLERDFSKETWSSYTSYDQSKLPEIAYGFWTWIFYRQDLNQLQQLTDFNQGLVQTGSEKHFWDSDKWWIKPAYYHNPGKNIPHNWQKAFSIIKLNRYLSAIFGLASVFLVFLIGRFLNNFSTGLIAMFLFAHNPIMKTLSRQAMGDTQLIFFILLSSYLFLFFYSKQDNHSLKKIKTWLYLGLCSGLAMAAKLNGLMVLILISLWELLLYFLSIFKKTKASYNHFFRLCLLVSITIGVFILCNPFTWSNPFTNIFTMYQKRYLNSLSAYNLPDTIDYYTPAQRAKAIIQEIILPSSEYSIFRNNLYFINQFLVYFFVFGLAILILAIYRQSFLQSKSSDDKRLLLFFYWSVGIFLIMSLYITVKWDRYFLPIIPFFSLIQALGIVKLFQLLSSFANSNLWGRL